jgi:hypothetical protein
VYVILHLHNNLLVCRFFSVSREGAGGVRGSFSRDVSGLAHLIAPPPLPPSTREIH